MKRPALLIQLLLIGLCAAAPVWSASAPVESFVEIPGGQAPLKATMVNPSGGKPWAIVVILPGSGPTDRDGNNPLGVSGRPYRLLAEGLAEQGIASLRMDKRGMFASGPAANDPNRVFISVLAADALAWAKRARAETGQTCAWLAGHSEGALVALVATRNVSASKDLCGLILLSGAGRPLGVILREQLNANPANAAILPQASHALNELEAGRTVDPSILHPRLQPLFRANVQDFLIEALAYDPASMAAAYDGPVLILQGTTDLQISLEDARKLQSAQPRAQLSLLEGVNHLLKAAPADRARNLSTYSDPSLPLAPGVVETIANFIRAHQ